jgi:hypothetical protein
MFLAGKRDTPIKNLDKIAEFFGVDVEMLLSEHDLTRQTQRLKPAGAPSSSETRLLAEAEQRHAEVLAAIGKHASSILELGITAEEGRTARDNAARGSAGARSRRR